MKLEKFLRDKFRALKNSSNTNNYIVTWVDNNELTRSTDSSNHEETNELEVNSDPEPSFSDLLVTSSLDSRAKKNKSTKNKKRRKHRKDDSFEPSTIDDSDSSNDSHSRRKQRKKLKTGRSIQLNYTQH